MSDHQSEPVVSVVITTYNSAQWLEYALESAIAQESSFPVEIVVADDCSSDGTVSLAQSYAQRFPGRFQILTRNKNVGTQRNYYEAFEAARGKYVAWLDADDYWTDRSKLERQVQALESDPTLSICGHYVRWVARSSETDIRRERYPLLPPGRHGLSDILRRNFLPSPSVMFRNGLHRLLPSWYFELSPITDWPLYILAAQKGDILLLDRIMADYTLTSNSAFWAEGEQFWYQNDIRFYDRIEEAVPPEWIRLVRSEKGKRYERLSYLLRKQNQFPESRRAAMNAFRAPAATDNVVSKSKTLIASLVREAQWRLTSSKAGTPGVSSGL